EHQVELARLGERALLATTRTRVRIIELVESEPVLAVRAIDEWISEVGQVTAGLPDLQRAQHGSIDQHDVVATLHHRVDPGLADVAQHQRAEWPVVVCAAEPAVDLGRRVHIAPSLAEIHYLFEIGRRHTRARLRASPALARMHSSAQVSMRSNIATVRRRRSM